MYKLSKSEYEILSAFYELNCALTRSELLAEYPFFNKNTVGMSVEALSRKGLLEVVYDQNTSASKARHYKPVLSMVEFYTAIYNYKSLKKTVKSYIYEIDDLRVLNDLLTEIRKKKELLLVE